MSDADTTSAEREERKAASIVECEECLSPAEAFAVVGNETRLSILEALWEAEERPVSFSELCKRVGMRDSAQFNYHLQKLTGQFLTKTDDGYDFRGAGRAVIQAVLAGSQTRDPELAPFPVEGKCIDCGGTLVAFYEDEAINVTCGSCDRPHAACDFPPGGLEDRSEAEIMAAFNQRVRHLLCLTADGVCPACNGRTGSTIGYGTRHPTLDDRQVTVKHECRRCGYEVVTSVGVSLLDDAEVVSFYRDHGVDLNAVPFWTLEWCITDRHVEVLDEDPWRFLVAVELDDERLEVTLDEALSVETEERVSL